MKTTKNKIISNIKVLVHVPLYCAIFVSMGIDNGCITVKKETETTNESNSVYPQADDILDEGTYDEGGVVNPTFTNSSTSSTGNDVFEDEDLLSGVVVQSEPQPTIFPKADVEAGSSKVGKTLMSRQDSSAELGNPLNASSEKIIPGSQKKEYSRHGNKVINQNAKVNNRPLDNSEVSKTFVSKQNNGPKSSNQLNRSNQKINRPSPIKQNLPNRSRDDNNKKIDPDRLENVQNKVQDKDIKLNNPPPNSTPSMQPLDNTNQDTSFDQSLPPLLLEFKRKIDNLKKLKDTLTGLCNKGKYEQLLRDIGQFCEQNNFDDPHFLDTFLKNSKEKQEGYIKMALQKMDKLHKKLEAVVKIAK